MSFQYWKLVENVGGKEEWRKRICYDLRMWVRLGVLASRRIGRATAVNKRLRLVGHQGNSRVERYASSVVIATPAARLSTISKVRGKQSAQFLIRDEMSPRCFLAAFIQLLHTVECVPGLQWLFTISCEFYLSISKVIIIFAFSI